MFCLIIALKPFALPKFYYPSISEFEEAVLETFFSLFNKRVSGEDYMYIIGIVKSIDGLSMHKQACNPYVGVCKYTDSNIICCYYY